MVYLSRQFSFENYNIFRHSFAVIFGAYRKRLHFFLINWSTNLGNLVVRAKKIEAKKEGDTRTPSHTVFRRTRGHTTTPAPRALPRTGSASGGVCPAGCGVTTDAARRRSMRRFFPRPAGRGHSAPCTTRSTDPRTRGAELALLYFSNSRTHSLVVCHAHTLNVEIETVV
jgi:hypothetical protein